MKITLLTLLHNLIIDIYENLLLLPFVVVYNELDAKNLQKFIWNLEKRNLLFDSYPKTKDQSLAHFCSFLIILMNIFCFDSRDFLLEYCKIFDHYQNTLSYWPIEDTKYYHTRIYYYDKLVNRWDIDDGFVWFLIPLLILIT